MSMMWRSSKTGFGTPLRDGIVIPLPLSGEASDMHAATAPMRVVIGRADQELLPSMCCRDVFVPCAITNGSAMPLHMASDPLVLASSSGDETIRLWDAQTGQHLHTLSGLSSTIFSVA